MPELPPTVNHYKGYNTLEKRTYLKPQVKTWRDLCAIYMGPLRHAFKPKGTVILLAELFSPEWVSKKNEMRENDLDNRFKAMQDAVKLAMAMEFSDSQFFEIHAKKVGSLKRATTIYLVDSGDVVDYDLT